MKANKEKICINKQITIIVEFIIKFKNIINNIKTTLLSVFLYMADVEDIWADIQGKFGMNRCRANPSIR